MAVSLAQPDGDWAAVPLTAEDGGAWSADVADAVVGQQCRYELTTFPARPPRVDPYARNVVDGGSRDANAAVVYDEQAFDWGPGRYEAPGWSELVVHELHVGSFSVQSGADVGTFYDVVAKLPYLQSLGINAIELLPVEEFEGEASWGYDPGVPFSIALAYGGPDGLKSLVRAAHEANIAVIVDVVYDHFGPPDSIRWDFDGEGPGWEGGIYFLRDPVDRRWAPASRPVGFPA